MPYSTAIQPPNDDRNTKIALMFMGFATSSACLATTEWSLGPRLSVVAHEPRLTVDR